MKKILSLILLITVFVGSAFATVDAYIIPLENRIYDDMDALYVISGRAVPSTSRPWSAGEAERILSRIKYDALNDSEKSIYDAIEKELSKMTPRWQADDEWTVGVGMKLEPELYAHSNTDDFTIDTDWAYAYDDRFLLAEGYFDTAVSNWFYTYSSLSFGISRYQRKDQLVGTDDKADIKYWDKNTDYPYGVGAIIPGKEFQQGAYDPILPYATHLYRREFSTNIPCLIDAYDIDFTMPKRAVISFGGPSWNLMFGRDRLNWGRSHIGNFTIDDHVGWHESLRFTANTEKFKYDNTNIFLETIPAMREWGKEHIEVPDATGPENAAATGNAIKAQKEADRQDAIPEFFKIYMNHRLEFAPWNPVRIAITESIMWKGKAFDLGAMNPSFIYHQLNNRAMFNCLASLEIFITPYKGINLYAEIGLDNATLIFEGDSQADANGWLIGTDYTHALRTGYIQASFEYAHTSPVMYRRDGVDFLMAQRCYTLGSGHQNATPKLYYIGFPYGPDADVLHAGVKYRMPGVFEVGCFWNGVRKGDMDLFAPHHAYEDKATGEIKYNNEGEANIRGNSPTGTGSKDFELFLYGSYDVPYLPDWMDLQFKATLAWVGKNGVIYGDRVYDNAQDVQFSFGVALNL